MKEGEVLWEKEIELRLKVYLLFDNKREGMRHCLLENGESRDEIKKQKAKADISCRKRGKNPKKKNQAT